MSRIFCIANRKGGTGKTSLTVNLAAAMGSAGRKVLVLDLDSQAHATLISGINPYIQGKGIHSLIKEKISIQNAIKSIPCKLFDIIPSFHSDATYNIGTYFKSDFAKQTGSTGFINDIKDIYDLILIDTPPSGEDIISYALSFSKEIIVPAPLEFLALDGVAGLMGFAQWFSFSREEAQKNFTIVPVKTRRFKSRHEKEMLLQLELNFGKENIMQGIRNDAGVKRAALKQVPLIMNEPGSGASKDFLKLAEYIINKKEAQYGKYNVV